MRALIFKHYLIESILCCIATLFFWLLRSFEFYHVDCMICIIFYTEFESLVPLQAHRGGGVGVVWAGVLLIARGRVVGEQARCEP